MSDANENGGGKPQVPTTPAPDGGGWWERLRESASRLLDRVSPDYGSDEKGRRRFHTGVLITTVILFLLIILSPNGGVSAHRADGNASPSPSAAPSATMPKSPTPTPSASASDSDSADSDNLLLCGRPYAGSPTEDTKNRLAAYDWGKLKGQKLSNFCSLGGDYIEDAYVVKVSNDGKTPIIRANWTVQDLSYSKDDNKLTVTLHHDSTGTEGLEKDLGSIVGGFEQKQ